MAKTPPKPAAKAPAKSAKPAAKPVLTKHNPKAVPVPAAKPAPVAKAAPAPPPPVSTTAAPAPIVRTTGLSPKQQRLLAVLQRQVLHRQEDSLPAQSGVVRTLLLLFLFIIPAAGVPGGRFARWDGKGMVNRLWRG